MSRPLRVFISAGERSGDLFAGDVVSALLKRHPTADVHGIGGARMAESGARLLADATGHAVMGLTRAVAEAGYFAGVYRRCVSHFNASPPDVFVPVDNPGFNLQLAALARSRGVPVAYYVSPQVWAWRRGRIRRISRLADRMLCILPFEPALYEAAGCDAVYVGHPALDYLVRANFDLGAEERIRSLGEDVVGLLPGSRRQEVLQVFPAIAAAAARISERRPQTRFVVGCAEPAHMRAAAAVLREEGVDAEIMAGKAWEIMRAAHCCIAASGTATLELGWFRRPMVIVYRAPRLLKPFVPRVLKSHFGLINVVAGREISPEFLLFGKDAAPVAQAALELLSDRRVWETQRRDLESAMSKVGDPGAAERAADAILELADQRRRVQRVGGAKTSRHSPKDEDTIGGRCAPA